MQLIFKVNTGTIKTGKNLQSRFNDNDKNYLELAEFDNKLLFNDLLHSKIKNTFGGLSDLDMSDKVNFNILKHKGINNISYDKKTRGCFITYTFKVS